MPNHCFNEVNFHNLDILLNLRLAGAVLNEKKEIDFEVLLPVPINYWRGNVGEDHKMSFKNIGMDWCIENWGTKWNAYGSPSIVFYGDRATMTFQTAWRPPYGWLLAIFNTLKVDFDLNWIAEGDPRAKTERFRWSEMEKDFGKPWTQEACSHDEQLRLHKCLWGVESFDDETEKAPSP